MKKIALFLLAVLVLFTACDGGSGVSKVEITVKPSQLTLKVGESSRIAVSVAPAGDYEFEWKSLDSNVATVNNGVVTAVAIGETSIEVNIKGSDDVKTVAVAVVGELDAVKYQGIYLMLDNNSPLYEVQNQEGEIVPVRTLDIMFVPDNFYVSAGQWAGSWDYPVVATTSVEDRRHLEGTGNDGDGFIMVFGYYNFLPVSEAVITDVNEAGDDIVAPYTFVTDDFNKENYEKFLYEALITYYNQEVPESVYEQYPYQSALGAYLYKWSWDDQVNFICGFPTGTGLMYSPGFPNEESYFADVAYDFNVKFFTNADYYGLDLVPGEDPETGEPVMNYPVDENGMPIIRMAEMTDYHFVGGTVEFPTEEAAAPRAGLTSAAIEKISAVNRMLLKSVTFNHDLQKMMK
ncbi:MAG: Ig-like domain-containing protein [Paludibacteraceae bacterium]|nr:Ig-like domain-containing protein [Paludibacteraceae bacterium]